MVGGSMNDKIKNIKRHEIKALLIALIVIVLANVVSAFMFTRIDLTSDKRYSLSDTTKDILRNIDDHVYFRVYLDGDLPTDFKKLKKEIKEMLDEFRAYSKFVDYEFINPSESDDLSERNDTYSILYQSGLRDYTATETTNAGVQQSIVWPCLILTYGDKEKAINLHDDLYKLPQEEVVYKASQELEYKLISAIKDVSTHNKKTIAFVKGHGEPADPMLYDIVTSLRNRYVVTRTTIDEQFKSLLTTEVNPDSSFIIKPAYDAIVIVKPTKPFSENEKLLIDQYVMYGGKVLWLLDATTASMDSLMYSNSTMTLAQDLNLDDMLFKYGVRLNKNIVLSSYCGGLPIAEQRGTDVQTKIYPWFYYPLLIQASDNPITRNIDPVRAVFASSLDTTTSAPEIKKTPLLSTIDYTRVSSVPTPISFDIISQMENMQEEQDVRSFFPLKNVTAAYLLSGTFTSLYENRIPKEYSDTPEGLKKKSVPNSMIVIADGDIIINQLALSEIAKVYNIQPGTPLPVGYDQFTDVTYGNKKFIENALAYLLEDEGLLKVRARNFIIRPLDKSIVNKNTLTIKIINVVLPSAIMIILGIVLAIFRKIKYHE